MGRYTRNRVIEWIVLGVIVAGIAALVVVSVRGGTLAGYLAKQGFNPTACDATPFPELRDTSCYRGPKDALLVIGSISVPPAGGRGLPRVTTYIGIAVGEQKTLRIGAPTKEALGARLAEAGLAPAR